MPKINQEEYEVLKELDDKWKWIARDGDNLLWAYSSKPYKRWGRWGGMHISDVEFVSIDKFEFIQWEDEPYNISELIEEYEKESEETEVKKDLDWAKIEIHKELDSWRNVEGGIDEDGINNILNIIDQLDEPEVLSQEWLDKHLFSLGDEYLWKEAVPVDDLQNLLVPKQEEVDKQKQSAYIDGFKEGKRQATDYFESITEKQETVAKVIFEYMKATQRLKDILSIEVKDDEQEN